MLTQSYLHSLVCCCHFPAASRELCSSSNSRDARGDRASSEKQRKTRVAIFHNGIWESYAPLQTPETHVDTELVRTENQRKTEHELILSIYLCPGCVWNSTNSFSVAWAPGPSNFFRHDAKTGWPLKMWSPTFLRFQILANVLFLRAYYFWKKAKVGILSTFSWARLTRAAEDVSCVWRKLISTLFLNFRGEFEFFINTKKEFNPLHHRYPRKSSHPWSLTSKWRGPAIFLQRTDSK